MPRQSPPVPAGRPGDDIAPLTRRLGDVEIERRERTPAWRHRAAKRLGEARARQLAMQHLARRQFASEHVGRKARQMALDAVDLEPARLRLREPVLDPVKAAVKKLDPLSIDQKPGAAVEDPAPFAGLYDRPLEAERSHIPSPDVTAVVEAKVAVTGPRAVPVAREPPSVTTPGILLRRSASSRMHPFNPLPARPVASFGWSASSAAVRAVPELDCRAMRAAWDRALAGRVAEIDRIAAEGHAVAVKLRVLDEWSQLPALSAAARRLWKSLRPRHPDTSISNNDKASAAPYRNRRGAIPRSPGERRRRRS